MLPVVNPHKLLSQNGRARNVPMSVERMAETHAGRCPPPARNEVQKDSPAAGAPHPAVNPESGKGRPAPSVDRERNAVVLSCTDYQAAQTTPRSTLAQKLYPRTSPADDQSCRQQRRG